MIGPAPACFECRHYLGEPGVPACAAFPGGIPYPIWLEGFDHRGSYEGDGGMRWEPREPGAQYPIPDEAL
jgi:hypothetical protein